MLKILIVEDDDSISDCLTQYLCEQLDVRCERAPDLQDGMLKLEKSNYDVIFLDLLLDGDMGTPLIGIARTWWPERPPKIVVVSAMMGAEKVAQRNAADYFLPKPFDVERLDEIISEISRKEIY